MNEEDCSQFHHQMKQEFHSLTDNVKDPLFLFNMLIKENMEEQEKLQRISRFIRNMKSNELMVLFQDENNYDQTPRREESTEQTKSSCSESRHPQTLKRSSTEQTLSPRKKTCQSNPDKSVDQPLTDQFILRFCSEMIGPSELMNLGVKGFKLSIVAIQRAQYDSKRTLDASIDVFTQWKNSAPFPVSTSWIRDGTMPPYTMRGLRKALKECNMNYAYMQLEKIQQQ